MSHLNPRPKPARRSRRGLWLSVGLTFGLLLPLQAQVSATLRITQVEPLPGDRLKVIFRETGTNALDYRLAYSGSLASGSTTDLDLLARIVDLGGGYYQTVIARPAEASQFYRIAGFAGPDTDGDGLSDSLEAYLGTNPNKFDTDGDGIGDAVELIHGASATNPASRPLITWANFDAISSSAREGGGPIALRVNLTQPFYGTLAYRIAAMSTAVSGEDFVPVSGTVSVSGTNVWISINLLDDETIEPTKLLAVDLLPDAAGSYQVGGVSRHTVLLTDNDAYWSGTMRTPDSAELGFRLRMQRAGGSVAAALVSELSTNNSQGVGAIPVGVWPVLASLTPTTFYAVSAPIPMGSTPLAGDVPLQRVLSFSANAGATNCLVRSNLIIGQFTDTLTSTQPDAAWVSNTVTGVVILIEDLPLLPPRQLPDEQNSPGLHTTQAKGGAQ